jgi:hypothetical protein
MEIREISIPEIYIPDVPEPYTPHYINVAKPPDIDGCEFSSYSQYNKTSY